ncbi:hypothetical protein FACS1894166_10030 [Bacilli bacterium]|nr:hypothetical protein FACS1894166_10030 [Bacilli bacterium]
MECETEDHGELTSNKVVRPLPITEEVNYISLDMSHLTEIRQMIGISRQWSNRTTFGYTVPNHVFELDFEK